MEEKRVFKNCKTKQLKDELLGLYDMIYVVECYGVQDLNRYILIEKELYLRGVETQQSLIFN